MNWEWKNRQTTEISPSATIMRSSVAIQYFSPGTFQWTAYVQRAVRIEFTNGRFQHITSFPYVPP